MPGTQLNVPEELVVSTGVVEYQVEEMEEGAEAPVNAAVEHVCLASPPGPAFPLAPPPMNQASGGTNALCMPSQAPPPKVKAKGRQEGAKTSSKFWRKPP